MLRFLFENKQGGKNQRLNFWIYGLGEFFLIFLGILIALQVDNWNQGRQDRNLEQVLLLEMLSNLKGDLEDIKYNTKSQERLLYSNQVVVDFLRSDIPWHDSLGSHFKKIMGGCVFDINTSAYESLKTIGIDLIRNDELRQQITGIYTARYAHVEATERILFNYIFDHLYPAIRENLRTISATQMIPVNLDKLRQNDPFLEDLNMNIFIYQVAILSYKDARESVIELITEIEQELGLDPSLPRK